MNARQVLLTLAATGAAGAVATRAARRRMSALIDDCVAADGDDPIDPLAFPPGSETTVATSDGARLAVVDCDGDGPPVLLVHGYTGTKGHWGPVATSLAEKGHRVVAYEQRGHGESTVGDRGFHMDALGDDMNEVIEHLDLRDVVVAGHSMGGMALQSFLGRHPESATHRVKAACLVSTASSPAPLPTLMRRGAPRVLGTALVERALSHPRVGAYRLRDVVGTEPRFSHLHAARTTVVATAPQARLGAFEMLAGYDLTEHAASVEVPTVITVGTHDNLTPIDQSHRLAELIPHAELVVHDGAGHMLPWERTDELTSLIKTCANASPADLPAAVAVGG